MTSILRACYLQKLSYGQIYKENKKTQQKTGTLRLTKQTHKKYPKQNLLLYYVLLFCIICCVVLCCVILYYMILCCKIWTTSNLKMIIIN